MRENKDAFTPDQATLRKAGTALRGGMRRIAELTALCCVL